MDVTEIGITLMVVGVISGHLLEMVKPPPQQVERCIFQVISTLQLKDYKYVYEVLRDSRKFKLIGRALLDQWTYCRASAD